MPKWDGDSLASAKQKIRELRNQLEAVEQPLRLEIAELKSQRDAACAQRDRARSENSAYHDWVVATIHLLAALATGKVPL